MIKINNYMNINRIEFTVTNACTSQCKHCSVGSFSNQIKTSIDKSTAVSVVAELSKKYDIESVMTFGGEPLLYADTTCAIHKTAAENGIPKRQVITNGYFSKNDDKIISVAKALKESGVNSLLLSIDVFHKEHIPLDTVYQFSKAVCAENISGFKLHPAWVVNREYENKYNEETQKCLSYFADLHIPISYGNNIFPSGNAAIYLSEFYEKKPIDLNMKCGEAPYTGKLDNIETIAINPNGDVVVCCFVIGNVYRDSITEIVNRYNPYENLVMARLISGGVGELIKFAEEYGITLDTAQSYSACGVCRDVVKKLSPYIG
jgi:MoaA/NifB/PqqE/SkfB family radical SAM enzyme